MKELLRLWECNSGEAGFVMKPASLSGSSRSASKRKPRSSRAWMTTARDFRGTRMKSDQ